MEKSMLGISWYKHIQSEVIIEGNRMNNVIAEYQKQKFYWTKYITMFTDNNCTHAVVKWYM